MLVFNYFTPYRVVVYILYVVLVMDLGLGTNRLVNALDTGQSDNKTLSLKTWRNLTDNETMMWDGDDLITEEPEVASSITEVMVKHPPMPANVSLQDLGHYWDCVDRFEAGWHKGIPGLVYDDLGCICFKVLCRENITFLHPPDGASESFYKEMLSMSRDMYHTEQIVYAVILCLAMFIGIFGNSLVLHAVRHYITKPSSTNVFICNLAVADLLVNLICTPARIVTMIYTDWFSLGLGVWPCRVLWYLYYISLMVSVFTMVAMSMERYMAVVHPMKAQYLSTAGRAHRVVALLWVLALLLSLPFLFLAYQRGYLCWDFRIGINYGSYLCYLVLVVLLLVPVTIMGVAYGKTAHVLLRSIKEAKSLQGSGSESKNKTKDNKKHKDDTRGRLQVVVMLLLMLVLFAICWCPYNLFRVIDVHVKIPFKENIEYFGCTLTLISSCLNPILYAIFSRQFRAAFRRILCSCTRTYKYNLDASTSGSSQTLSTTASTSTLNNKY